MSKKGGIVPELRFPEFKNNWEIKPLYKVYEFKITNSLSRDKLNYDDGKVKNIHYGDIHTKFSTLFDITKEDVPFINCNVSIERIDEDNYCQEGDIVIADASEDMDDIGKSIELVNLNREKLLAGLHTFLARRKMSNPVLGFGGYLFKSNGIRNQIQREAQGAKVLGISKGRISSINIFYPNSPKEQQKITKCLSSLDEVITAETEKLELLKEHKKGLLQQLFPQEGETQPKYRFPEFKDDGDWEETILEECLDYLQPTPYLVCNTNYDDKYAIPVLTAGKTFILGYTNEKEGIYKDNLPVIIFDDFTTASKFVDFEFKVKSSAMKILLAKGGNNIKFMFEAIQNLKFEVSTHKRHWISVYSKLDILKPSGPKEQQKIANCLTSVDGLIVGQAQKLEVLQNHKKGLLQQLFPNVNDVVV